MIGDFILAAVILGGGLLVLFFKSTQKDRADETRRRMQASREKAAALEEARKYQAGVRLVCLSCETRFAGPLTDAGCPKCHLSALVMTEAQLKQTQEAEKNENEKQQN